MEANLDTCVILHIPAIKLTLSNLGISFPLLSSSYIVLFPLSAAPPKSSQLSAARHLMNVIPMHPTGSLARKGFALRNPVVLNITPLLHSARRIIFSHRRYTTLQIARHSCSTHRTWCFVRTWVCLGYAVGGCGVLRWVRGNDRCIASRGDAGVCCTATLSCTMVDYTAVDERTEKS